MLMASLKKFAHSVIITSLLWLDYLRNSLINSSSAGPNGTIGDSRSIPCWIFHFFMGRGREKFFSLFGDSVAFVWFQRWNSIRYAFWIICNWMNYQPPVEIRSNISELVEFQSNSFNNRPIDGSEQTDWPAMGSTWSKSMYLIELTINRQLKFVQTSLNWLNNGPTDGSKHTDSPAMNWIELNWSFYLVWEALNQRRIHWLFNW